MELKLSSFNFSKTAVQCTCHLRELQAEQNFEHIHFDTAYTLKAITQIMGVNNAHISCKTACTAS